MKTKAKIYRVETSNDMPLYFTSIKKAKDCIKYNIENQSLELTKQHTTHGRTIIDNEYKNNINIRLREVVLNEYKY
jgi:hypothetical protein